MTGRPKNSSVFAKRSLGQNFLSDPNYIKKIVDAVSPDPEATIIEIGPGRGAITDRLVESGAEVTAIELDSGLIALLRERFAGAKNVRVIEADATNVDYRLLLPAGRKAKLVANLPYYISTAILQHLIEQRDVFESLTLMFQKEVVDRILAEPGESERGFLTVFVQTYLEVQRLFDVPPNAFRPRPKVHSSVARFIPLTSRIRETNSYRELLSRAFTQKRKTILNNLRAHYPDIAGVLAATGIEPARRAESLTNEEWLRLHEAILEVR